MNHSKTPSELAVNASKLHKLVGELLTSEESPYKNFEIRQEYPVSKVNEVYHNNREKFDWAILGLKVIIEVHGQQHFFEVCFGGITKDEARVNLKKRQEVDLLKQTAAEEAGWAYIVVKYTEKHLDLDTLTERIIEALGCVPEGVVAPKKEKIKIPKPKVYNWPKGKKIQGRKFNGEPTNH
jgi:hypothetical protein